MGMTKRRIRLRNSLIRPSSFPSTHQGPPWVGSAERVRTTAAEMVLLFFAGATMEAGWKAGVDEVSTGTGAERRCGAMVQEAMLERSTGQRGCWSAAGGGVDGAAAADDSTCLAGRTGLVRRELADGWRRRGVDKRWAKRRNVERCRAFAGFGRARAIFWSSSGW